MNASTAQLLIPAAWPAALLPCLALLAAGLWTGLHLARPARAGRFGRGVRFAMRTLIGTLALALAAEGLGRYLALATAWPLAAAGFAGSLGVEAVMAFYGEERRLVPPARGRLLAGLRVALVLLLWMILLQPVWVHTWDRVTARQVAVVLDVSASMQVADNGLTGAEKLRLAARLRVPGVVRSVRLDAAAAALALTQQNLGAASAALFAGGAAAGDTGRTAVVQLAGPLAKAVKTALDDLRGPAGALAEALAATRPDSANAGRPQLIELGLRLQLEVAAPLTNALALLRVAAAAGPRADADTAIMLADLRAAASALGTLTGRLQEAGELLDEETFKALSSITASRVEQAVLRRRCDLALELLRMPPLSDATGSIHAVGWLERLRRQYGVNAWLVDGEAAPIALEALGRPDVTNRFNAGPGRATDLAAALSSVAAAIPEGQLAGVILLTDGRHLAPSDLETPLRALAARHAPVFPVLFGGGRHPPLDAGVIGVEAPETVRTNDRVRVAADLKFDGLNGSNALVSLYRDGALVATSMVAVAGDSLRSRVALSDTPGTNGYHEYRLAVQRFPGEVSLTNNDAILPVMVSDEQIRLLVIDGHPRWEYRYLKNLFIGRDRSIRMQQVLLHPDAIAGQPLPPLLPASATNAEEQTEATALPANPEEWMRFDAIWLGDVERAAFTNDELNLLQRFVAVRGGLLVVVAGPRDMPHAYGDTPLAGLLPVEWEPVTRPWLGSPESGFRMALTDEGREHAVTRLEAEPAASARVWEGMPEIAWRHALRGVKEGASVLLYAQTPDAPDYLASLPAGAAPSEDLLRQRRQYQREHALVALQRVGAGHVAFLAFDQTWRLRYRTGETYHQRFWGQMLRWGVGERLASGTRFVRLGAARLRVPPGERAVIRARLLQRDYAPVRNAVASLQVFSGGKPLLRKALAPVQSETGLYEADLGALPVGDYRVRLEGAAVDELLAPDGVSGVETAFCVSPASLMEFAELAGDRGAMQRLAALTGGQVLEPATLDDLSARLGPPSVKVVERRQQEIWNSAWLFALALALAGSEWWLRKKASLV